MRILFGAGLWLLPAWFGCASTQIGQARAEFAQCRNPVSVRVTLGRSADGDMQVRSGHPCPPVVFPLEARGDVSLFAVDRSATGWRRLDSRVALREGARPPYWNVNTLDVAVQEQREWPPYEVPLELRVADFLMVAYRHPEGGAALELLAPSGEILQRERLGASAAWKALTYGFAGFLDLLSLPLLPFMIVSAAMTGG